MFFTCFLDVQKAFDRVGSMCYYKRRFAGFGLKDRTQLASRDLYTAANTFKTSSICCSINERHK